MAQSECYFWVFPAKRHASVLILPLCTYLLYTHDIFMLSLLLFLALLIADPHHDVYFLLSLERQCLLD